MQDKINENLPKNFELISSLFDSERADKQKEVVKWIIDLREINAIIQELKEYDDVQEKVDALIMLCPVAYLLIKKEYKNLEKFQKFQNFNWGFEYLVLEDFENEEVLDYAMKNGVFMRLTESLKLNDKIFMLALKNNRVHFMESEKVIEKVLKNVEYYVMFLDTFMESRNKGVSENSFKLSMQFINGTLKIRLDEDLKKEHLKIFQDDKTFKYFLDNYKNIIPEYIFKCMKKNKNFKKLTESHLNVSKDQDILDYRPLVRELYLKETLSNTEIVNNNIRKKKI